jgi:hypothetical protein
LVEWLSLPLRIREVEGPNPHVEEEKDMEEVKAVADIQK